jgi:hypothetical protein
VLVAESPTEEIRNLPAAGRSAICNPQFARLREKATLVGNGNNNSSSSRPVVSVFGSNAVGSDGGAEALAEAFTSLA